MLLLAAALIVTGCTRGPSGGSTGDRVKALESQCAKLEEDYRAVADARDAARKKAKGLEEESQHLKKELAGLNDEHQKTVKEGTAVAKERDDLRLQLEQFRNSLRSLLGQAESALGPNGPAASTGASAPTGG
jgi:chromosome segregation ATPase